MMISPIYIRLKQAIIVLLVAVSTFACEREDLTISTETESNVVSATIGEVPIFIKDGLVEFASMEALDKALYTKGIVENGVDIPGNFQSAHQAYNLFISDETKDLVDVENSPNLVTIINWEGEKYLEPVVANDALSHLANKDGLISLSGKMAKVDREAIRVVSSEDYNTLGLVAFSSSSSLEVKPFKKTTQMLDKRNVISPERAEFRGRNRRGNEVGPTFRLTGNLESTESLIGPNRLICRSKLFKRRLGIWWGTSGRLTNDYHLFGTYSTDDGFSFSFNRAEGPVSENAQNFPLIVGTSDEFTSGNRNGIWSVGVNSIFEADASKNRGEASIVMVP